MTSIFCSIDESLEKFLFSSKAWPSFAKFMLKLAPHNIEKQVLCNINEFLAPATPLNKVKDATASQKAMAFRNGAALLAIIGIMTFYLAILPYAAEIPEHIGFSLGVAEVMLFCITVLLALYLIQKKLQWIQVRSDSELKRYKRLNDLILMEHKKDELNTEFQRILTDQIGYNEARFEMYEAIENGSSRLSWFLFIFTFVAVIGHLYCHLEWLLLVTAGFPMIAASIHALNSLANVTVNLNDHKRLFRILKHIESDRNRSLLDSAKNLYMSLTDNVGEWGERTKDSPVNA